MKQQKSRNNDSPFIEPEPKEGPEDLKISPKDWQKIKGGLLSERIKARGYHISTPLVVIIGFVVPLLFILYLAVSQGVSERWALNCPKDSFNKCLNPFFSCDPMTTTWCPSEKLQTIVCGENPGLCLMPLIEPGESYGHRKNFIEKHFFLIVVGCLAVAYFLNHGFYNSAQQRAARIEKYKAGGKNDIKGERGK